MANDDDQTQPLTTRPVDVKEPAWMDTARKVEQRKYAETVSSALRIDEAAYIILNTEGQIERKAVEEDMALEFARDRVDQTGQLKVVYKRVAVVRHRNTTDFVSVE